MSEPVLAALTLLAWGIGMGVFIVVMKYCGGCRKGHCDTPKKASAAKKTDAGAGPRITPR